MIKGVGGEIYAIISFVLSKSVADTDIEKGLVGM
jgi:hypothetical protein